MNRPTPNTIRRAAVCIAAAVFVVIAAGGARGNALRLRSLSNASLALEDRDNSVNPLDFGRNPSWLHRDFDYPYIRFAANLEEISGGLRRENDPNLVNDLFVGFAGVKTLGERQVVRGYIDYQRLWNRGVYRSLEPDPYNDPFYLRDLTRGDFEYYGPRASVDWSLRLRDGLYIGAGFDYEINTGLKQVYTRPEIVHNYFRGVFGLAWEPVNRWVIGAAYRPLRLQNRTKFAKPDEGYDNVIQSYAGDHIYEVRTFSSYQIMEVLLGHEAMLQAFYMRDELNAGLVARIGISENEVKHNPTRQFEKGFWSEDLLDLQLRARYAPRGRPFSLGVKGGLTRNDGWGIRPEFPEVLLYDNPFFMYTAGAGVAWRFMPIDVTLIGEYVFEKYDIEVSDFGGNLFRTADMVTNIGRFAGEKRILDVYSFRAGFEYVDYPVDRWVKMPRNIDSSRITGGLGYYVGGWNIDLHLAYGRSVREDADEKRRELSAVIWFTKIVR